MSENDKTTASLPDIVHDYILEGYEVRVAAGDFDDALWVCFSPDTKRIVLCQCHIGAEASCVNLYGKQAQVLWDMAEQKGLI